MEAINNPENEVDGSHTITFARELWIEREDFMEDAPAKFFRNDTRQRSSSKKCIYYKVYRLYPDEKGNITEIQAEYDP